MALIIPTPDFGDSRFVPVSDNESINMAHIFLIDFLSPAHIEFWERPGAASGPIGKLLDVAAAEFLAWFDAAVMKPAEGGAVEPSPTGVQFIQVTPRIAVNMHNITRIVFTRPPQAPRVVFWSVFMPGKPVYVIAGNDADAFITWYDTLPPAIIPQPAHVS